jgi:hypothetical protein
MTVPFASPQTPGNRNTVKIKWRPEDSPYAFRHLTVTDSAGNAYTLTKSGYNLGGMFEVTYCAENIKGGENIIEVNLDGISGHVNIEAEEEER